MADLLDRPWTILIIAVVIIVLFGSRKLPDAARSLGKSMRILKTEVKGLQEDDEDSTAATSVQSAPAQLQAPAAPAAPAAPDAQSQIDALTKQLADLQQSVAASKTDSTQAQ